MKRAPWNPGERRFVSTKRRKPSRWDVVVRLTAHLLVVHHQNPVTSSRWQPCHGVRRSVTPRDKKRGRNTGHDKNNVSRASLTGDENKDRAEEGSGGMVARPKDGRTDKSRQS